MTDPLRDRVAAALYERERPPRDPAWPDAYDRGCRWRDTLNQP